MNDLRLIARALDRSADAGESSVLATVVHVSGSAYRGIGARMLIAADGSRCGLVSGGCLESDLAARSHDVLASGHACLVTYDTRSSDDLVWGLGLGCDGVVRVLLEPLRAGRASSLAALLRRAAARRDRAVLALHVEESPEPARMLVESDAVSPVEAGAWSSPARAAVRSDAAALLRDAPDGSRGTARTYAFEGESMSVAFEICAPAIQVVICGAGPDVAPVATLASAMGWEVVVVDHRSSPGLASRFRDALVVECPDPGVLAQRVDLAAHSYAVVMTHHFERDLGYLDALLRTDVPYIGMLGPRERTERLLARRAAAMDPVTSAMRDRIYAPVGLDLGGEGPDAIAVAIVAEIMATANGRRGEPLRDRDGPIHETA